MSLPADILALRDLVAEGQLTWSDAVLQLREDHELDLRQVYTCGAAELLQRADAEFSAKVRRVTMLRHLSGQALVINR